MRFMESRLFLAGLRTNLEPKKAPSPFVGWVGVGDAFLLPPRGGKVGMGVEQSSTKLMDLSEAN